MQRKTNNQHHTTTTSKTNRHFSKRNNTRPNRIHTIEKTLDEYIKLYQIANTTQQKNNTDYHLQDFLEKTVKCPIIYGVLLEKYNREKTL